MQSRTYDIHLAEKKIVAEIGDLADQADGAVLMRSGDTIVHVACVGKKPTRPDSGFLPLTVEYEERFYARGALLGSQFVRREGRPSEEAVLTARAIDRAIRPLFAPWLREEIQVVATVLSYDPAEEPGYLALIGASLALAISPIPWNGPLGASRITSEGDGLLVAAKKGKIVMLEAGTSERQADDCAPLFEKALAECEKIESWIEKITEGEGAQKRQVSKPPFPATFPELFAREIEPGLSEALDKARTSPNRFKKQGFFEEARRRWTELAKGAAPDTDRNSTELFFEEALRGLVRERTLKGARIDGREKDELRPIEAATGTFGERVHGSGTFYRGATHVASFLTVGPDKDALAVNGMEVAERKHFIHHYNFPPFSAGETGRMGSPNRRSIGHGALVEKALRATLPPLSAFPHTLRVVSEVFASNGSTSMASVCAASLALLDGGVPVKHTAGIAIGLVEEDGVSALLTDIQGAEDHYGDMDFKVAGTKDGITALQLDVKNDGISKEVAVEALTAGMEAVRAIISHMKDAAPNPRSDLRQSAKEALAARSELSS